MKSRIRLQLHHLLGALLLCLAFAAPAQAATITGFSDQNIARYAPTADSIYDTLAKPQVRFITAWDVALHDPGAGACPADDGSPLTVQDDLCRSFVALKGWIQRAEADGKTIMVSLDHSVSCDYRACPLPSPGNDYRYAVDQFRQKFPKVAAIAPWNEPNHSIGLKAPNSERETPLQPNPVNNGICVQNNSATGICGATAAAKYWIQVNQACATPVAGSTCTAVAGDFSEETNLSTYTDAYQQTVAAATPPVWAVHGYGAVDHRNTERLFSWINAKTGSKPVWITEIGAYNCHTNETAHNDDYQRDRAEYFNYLLNTAPARVNRVYYYFLSKGNGEEAACSHFDTALIGAGDRVRPALRVLFPGLQAPGAVTGTATSAQTTSATLNGTVDARGIVSSYRFDYGTTTSYGSSTPESDAGRGQGAVARSATITGLQPGTTYHYRIVASSALGTSHGEDRVFKTVDAGGLSAIRDASNGNQWAYYIGSNNQLCSWRQLLSAGTWTWSNSCLAGGQPPAAGMVPAAIRDANNGNQWIYYIGSNNHLCLWGLAAAASSWTNHCPGGGQAAAPETRPSVVRDAGSQNQWIYYIGSSNHLCLWGLTAAASTWTNYCPGGGQSAAPDTSPVAVRDAGSQNQWIYYIGSSNHLCLWGLTAAASSWTNHCPGGGQAAAPETRPSVVRDAGSQNQWIYYIGSNNQLCSWRQLLSAGTWTWSNSCLAGGQPPAAGTAPAAIRDANNGNQWIYYVGTNSQLCLWGFTASSSSWDNHCPGGGQQGTPTGWPAVVRDPNSQEHWAYYLGSNRAACLWGLAGAPLGWANYCPPGGQPAF
jgi:hypothetical protein